MIVFLETLIIYKHSEDTVNLVDAPTSYWILIPWFVALISSLSMYIYLMTKKNATSLYKGNEIVESSSFEITAGREETPGQFRLKSD